MKAIWIIHTNPVVSMSEADLVAKALQACPFVVVQDVTAETDTARLAHVLLPATAWAEKDGTVTNSERRISRQRPALPTPDQARDDWRILAAVAGQMGWGDVFGWTTAAEVFVEYAVLSGVAGNVGSDFDISDMASLDHASYDAMEPFTWPANPRQQGGRFFGDGRLYTPDGKGLMPAAIAPAQPGQSFRLNAGRIRDQWHTMTRTAKSSRLSAHLAEPFLELHPTDARRIGVAEADLVEVTNPLGRAVLRVLVTDCVATGQPFAPMHWTGETASYGRVDALVAASPDSISGQPDFKAATVDMRKFLARWYGFAVSAAPIQPETAYWAKTKVDGGWQVEMAGDSLSDDWIIAARKMFGLPEAEVASVIDQSRGNARVVFHQSGHLLAALFTGPEPVELSRNQLIARLGQDKAHVGLAGRSEPGRPDPGPTVCACLNVGLNTIRDAIQTGRALSVTALGEALGAGTSCGSCRPELAGLIDRFQMQEAAE